ncbi:Holliday junction branch migration protein RuvA [Cognatishimia sp. WU-CL00825]|uniref:Holliday junction branch migration protein RuvA n=1 Tax=Cognatishimia sp. WU-CL00825 TaxID=3127658 RepID=UPI0031042BD9
MIGKLSGRIEYRTADHILIDVRGVGYIVYCSERTLMGLPGNGEIAALYTEMLVREDLLQLFGFPTLLEKEWHRLLTSVQGIGAKASLSILGALGPEGVGRAITLGDVAAIKVAKGIGPKTAQRVVLELKDKAPAVMALGGTLQQAAGEDIAQDIDVIESIAKPAKSNATTSVASSSAAAQAEALSALSNLGYGPSDAAAAVAEAASGENELDTLALIKAALQLLAPKG